MSKLKLTLVGFLLVFLTVGLTLTTSGLPSLRYVEVQEENKPPVADFTYSPSNPEVGETVSFKNLSYDPEGTIANWYWDFDDGTTSSVENPKHTYPLPGTRYVCLAVSDNYGDTDKACKDVAIKRPLPPKKGTIIYESTVGDWRKSKCGKHSTGEYVVDRPCSGMITQASFRNFILEVDVRDRSVCMLQPGVGEYGVIFGNSFKFHVQEPNGVQGKFKLTHQGETILDWTESPYIKATCSSYNHLKLATRNSVIWLYVNNHLFTTYSAEVDPIEGSIGIFTNSNREIRFNNLKVYSAKGGESLPKREKEQPAREKEQPTTAVNFPDPDLKKAMRGLINKPTGEIYPSDMKAVTKLDLRDSSINDLTGLSYLTNLTELRLGTFKGSNEISDFSPLKNLTKLIYLDLSYLDIHEISALANLTKLRKLDLCCNRVTDLSPLRSLTNLRELDLCSNIHLSDISALANLTNLTRLRAPRNSISDLNPLVGLTNLTILNLHHNQIRDISALVANKGLGRGDMVDLRHNPLDTTPGSEDMQDIQALQSRGVSVKIILGNNNP